VRLIRSERARGPAAARNAGIQAAPGADIYALCDSDDLYLPGKIEQSLRLMAPGVGLVYSDYETLSPEGLVLRQWKEPFCRRRLAQECLPNSDSLFLGEALRANLFDEGMRVCEDYHVWARLSARYMVRHLAEPLVRIRTGPHSSTSTVSREEWLRCHARVMEAFR
jgi:glycosyltransferase involved in cell wall biosynthesis